MLKGIGEGATYFYHPDHLGSVSVVSNHKGVPYERVEYLPFGEVWIEDVDPATRYIPFRFTSKELDRETGLYYYGARYYEPKVSRWMSADPAGWELINPMDEDGEPVPNGWPEGFGPGPSIGMRPGYSVVEASNWYSYTSNNPVKYVDPTGESEVYGTDITGSPIVDYPGRDLKSETEIVTTRKRMTRINEKEFYTDQLDVKIGNQTVFSRSVQSTADIEEPRLSERYGGRTLEPGTYDGLLKSSTFSYEKPIALVGNFLIHPDLFTTDARREAQEKAGRSSGPWSQPYSAGCLILRREDFDTMTETLEGIGFKYNYSDTIKVEIQNRTSPRTK